MYITDKKNEAKRLRAITKWRATEKSPIFSQYWRI